MLACAIGGLTVFVAVALAAPRHRADRRPVVSHAAPLVLRHGAKLTITGRGFVAGSRHNRVVFLGGRGNGDDVESGATLAKTAQKLVLNAPEARIVAGGPGAVSGPIAVVNRWGRSRPSGFVVRFDDDGDGLSNEAEIRAATNPRDADSDGDGIPDGLDPEPLHPAAPSPGSEASPPETPLDTAPDTIIDAGPAGTTFDTTPTFQFHSTEPSSTFECSIDQGTPSFGACSGPGATHTPAAPLADGSYTFRVRAIDSAKNADPTPATATFVVSTSFSCNNLGPTIAGTGLTSTFQGIENVTAEGRSKIGHGAFGGGGFKEICLLRKQLGEPDSTYQVVRSSSSAAAGVLSDGQRPQKDTEYVFRTDVVTNSGRIPGANTVVAHGAASLAGAEGWAQLQENCAECGSSSVQAGSLRSTVKSDGVPGFSENVGEVAVYKDRVALGWHPSALPEHPEQAGTLASARVLVPLPPSAPDTHIDAQMNLSVEHPATMRDSGTGSTVDLRDSSQPWISVAARRSADGSIKVVVSDSASAEPEDLVAESGDLTTAGLQNIYLTVQLSAPDRYTVRYKPNTQEPDEDVVLDLDPGPGTDRALPGSMPEAWISLTNEMSRAEPATHDVRFDEVDVVYQTDYRDLPIDNFGGVGDNLQVPAGFSAEKVSGDLLAPTAIDFASNGDMYIALRDGKVMRLNHETAEGENVAELEEVLDIEDLVNSGPNDHGLTGFVLDPNFESNGFFYVYYTVQKADTFEDRTVSRVERFHVGIDGKADRADPLRKVLVGADGPAPDTGEQATNNACPPGPTSDCLPSDHYTHSSGGLQIGSDGKLWISTPDGATPDGVEADGTDHLSLRAIDPESLAGKILRVDPATGEGVAGNPEYATQANKKSPRARIWAMGFRNPFRIAQRPNSPGSWYATDVGWGAWEELDAIPGTATAGSIPSYGWPCYEGALESVYKTDYPSQCAISPPTPPLYEYDSSGVDHAIIGSTFYTGSAYPAPWKPGPGEAAFYFGDYPSGDITMVKTDSADQIVAGGVQAFASGFTSPVMIAEGPTSRAAPLGEQTLYIVDLGPIDEARGKIWRITYEGP